jgi:hypothetical protein
MIVKVPLMLRIYLRFRRRNRHGRTCSQIDPVVKDPIRTPSFDSKRHFRMPGVAVAMTVYSKKEPRTENPGLNVNVAASLLG